MEKRDKRREEEIDVLGVEKWDITKRIALNGRRRQIQVRQGKNVKHVIELVKCNNFVLIILIM